jgi:hypothetical protein
VNGRFLVLTRSQQLGLVILLFVFIAYLLLRLRA